MGGDFIASELVRLSTGYDYVKGAIDLAIGEFVPPKFTQKMYAGVHSLSKETEYIKKYINNCKEYEFVIDAHVMENELLK